MAEISAKIVMELRKATGLGMMDCKQALQETDGDLEKAVEFLRKKGMAAVEKRAGRDATDGLIVSYIHPGSRLGVLVEVNCETDFVARTEDFQQFAHDVAMHIAASQPLAVRRDDIEPDLLEKEQAIYLEQAKNEGNLADAEYLDMKQYAYKIYANSLYGLLGLRYFQFYDRECAHSITSLGVTGCRSISISFLLLTASVKSFHV